MARASCASGEWLLFAEQIDVILPRPGHNPPVGSLSNFNSSGVVGAWRMAAIRRQIDVITASIRPQERSYRLQKIELLEWLLTHHIPAA